MTAADLSFCTLPLRLKHVDSGALIMVTSKNEKWLLAYRLPDFEAICISIIELEQYEVF
ncbi:MAG: hypothetical protein ACOYOV_00185 [Bacteroidales bacterium]